jgi:hypothetical protein
MSVDLHKQPRREKGKRLVLKDQEERARIVVDCGYRLHRELGLLINFGAATFKEGTRRIMNNSVA